jgi:hypothetical protein
MSMRFGPRCAAPPTSSYDHERRRKLRKFAGADRRHRQAADSHGIKEKS